MRLRALTRVAIGLPLLALGSAGWQGALSALGQGWDRPGTRPTVTDNGPCVIYAPNEAERAPGYRLLSAVITAGCKVTIGLTERI